MNWLPVNGRVQHLKLSMIYKLLQGLCPNYFTECFQFCRDSRGLNMRASVFNLKQSDLKSKVGRSTFLYTGGGME